MSQSTFAQALQRLLDETNLWNRNEWSDLLAVDLATIENWLADQAFPNSTNLFMIFTSVATRHNLLELEPEPAVVAFERLLRQPISQISPVQPDSDRPGVSADLTLLEFMALPKHGRRRTV